MSEVTVLESKSMDIGAIADHVANYITGHISGHTSGAHQTIAVPGGSTPFPIFDALTQMPLNWDDTRIVLTDDRLVPDSHPASNQGKLSASFAKTSAQMVALHEGMDAPDFDLVWLGMGADGHIASLFPNTDPQLDAPATVIRLTPVPLPPEAPFDRLSWTLPALLNTKAAMLVIKGADKREVLDAAISGASDLPIARFLGALTSPLTVFWSET